LDVVPSIDLNSLPPASDEFIPPMQCLAVSELPERGWQYEIKFDGYRALAFCNDKESELISRNNNRLTSEFADIARRLRQLESGLMLDGEIVALDPRGRPSFNALQNRAKNPPVFYYVFDVLAYRNRSLLSLPLSKAA
jgi:ATP-dependent DNA ligase